MKIRPILALIPAMILPAEADPGCCPERGVGTRIFRDAATHDTLAKTNSGEKVENPIAAHKLEKPLKPLDEDKVAKRQDIVSRSEIIHRGPLVTLVPKRSVLHLPSHLQGLRGRVTGKQLVNWPEFYRVNRAWIDTVEVTRAMAEGRQPLPEKLVESLEKRSKAVIAVLQGGPISVLPHIEPETPVAGAETSQ